MTQLTFPLVQRRKVVGLSFAAMRSVNRGVGSDIAGTRPYRPGDNMKAIHWPASARLSLARDADEFVVRERYAEEAARVVVVADRRPSMSLYPAPWLDKRAALGHCLRLISDSAVAARSFLGYLDHADGKPEWRAPRSQHPLETAFYARRSFTAPQDALALALRHLRDTPRDLPSGSFLFVVSDFLSPPPPELWRDAVARRWDVVPAVLQDPVWERSFPDIGGIAVPFADPRNGRLVPVHLTEREAAEQRAANERRWRELLGGFRRLGIEPVLVDSPEPRQILAAFLGWAERRLYARGAA